MEKRILDLILFTNSFPFGLKETYLETEITYLCRAFNIVHIYPLYYNNKNKIPRQVPENAVVHIPPIPVSKKIRVLKFIISLLKGAPINEFTKEFFIFKLYSSSEKFKRWLFELVDYCIVSDSKQMKIIKEKRNGIFYFYWGTGWSYSLNYLNKIDSNSYFVRVHGGEAFLERNNGYIPLRNEVFSGADYILPISNVLKEYINKYYYVEESKILLSRLGTISYGDNPISNSSIIRIVTVANLIELKRIDLLITVLKDIKTRIIEWYHFGDGPLEKKIIYDAQQLLPSNVKFIYSKRIKNNKLLEFYKKVPLDCLINLSIYEGLPVSIMEAMSFGIPVIATNAGATSEIVNNENGLLLPVNFDLNNLREVIINLKSVEWRQKRQKAKMKWKKEFSAEKNYYQLIQLLKL